VGTSTEYKYGFGLNITSFRYRCYDWSARGENRSKIGDFAPKFQVEGVVPTNHFCTNSYANKCLTTLLLTVFTQINFVADSHQVSAILHRKPPFCVLERLGAKYDFHLRLTGKRVMDLEPVLILNFFSLGVTAEAIRANVDWSAISLQRGQFDPIFQVEGVPPTNHSSSRARLNVLIVWYKNLDRYFFRFVTIQAFDKRTDGQTERQRDEHLCCD